jgi:restriction endonuclease Mrr
VRHFRQAWKRLNAEQRLAQSRAALPQNAGPLNSQHLVHKALQQMRQLSPAYFERFVARWMA